MRQGRRVPGVDSSHAMPDTPPRSAATSDGLLTRSPTRHPHGYLLQPRYAADKLHLAMKYLFKQEQMSEGEIIVLLVVSTYFSRFLEPDMLWQHESKDGFMGDGGWSEVSQHNQRLFCGKQERSVT